GAGRPRYRRPPGPGPAPPCRPAPPAPPGRPRTAPRPPNVPPVHAPTDPRPHHAPCTPAPADGSHRTRPPRASLPHRSSTRTGRQAPTRRYDPSMPPTPYEETADTRPRVRRDVLLTATPDRVALHNPGRQAPTRRYDPSMPTTPYEETADTRPRVRRDVLFTETPDGVIFHNADGGFQVTSPSAYRFATLLVPHLDGSRTVAEICTGFK